MTDASENSQHGHVFRPALLRCQRAYWLHGDVLRWRIGAREGQVQLRDIASVRLQFSGPGQRCVVVERTGRTHALSDHHWVRWGRYERREASFQALVFTLARRVRKLAPEAVLLFGPSRAEWIGTWIVAVLALGLLLLGIGLMVAHGRFEPAAAAFLGMLACTLPPVWPVLRSGGPKPLDPATLHAADAQPDR